MRELFADTLCLRGEDRDLPYMSRVVRARDLEVVDRHHAGFVLLDAVEDHVPLLPRGLRDEHARAAERVGRARQAQVTRLASPPWMRVAGRGGRGDKGEGKYYSERMHS